MSTTAKTATKKTVLKIAGGITKPKKLSKLGEWRKANPEGIMIVNDSAVLHGLSVYEIFN
jgi:hypothetical protein